MSRDICHQGHQGITKLSVLTQMGHGIFVLVQKDSKCQKRKFLMHGTLNIVYQIDTRKSKKENQVN
jgi:hypothetical protein